MKKTITLIFLMFQLFGNLTIAQNENSSVQRGIDSLCESYMDEYRISALSVGIVKEGKPFYSTGYGFTSFDRTFLVNEETQFYVASVTKLFTASAIMQLVEDGKLDLDEKIAFYLPEFTMKDKRYLDITVYHLLTHTSGLKWDNYLKDSPNDSTALAKFIGSLNKSKLKFKPGEKFDGSTYSNTGYDILGYLVQRVSGLNYNDYIKRHLLVPSEMNNTTFNSEEVDIEKMAIPNILSGGSREIRRFNLYGIVKDVNPVLKYPENEIIKRKVYDSNSEHDPSGNLLSSSSDLVKWMTNCLAILDDTSHTDTHFLSAETLSDMWELKESIENKITSIGLCWWRYEDEKYGDYVYHVGRDPGTSTTLMIFPEQNFGITILCNAMYADQIIWNKLPFEIIDIIESGSR